MEQALRALSEPEWFDLYLAHARGERDDVVPFPSEEIQVVTNGQSGETTGRGAVGIWQTMLEAIRAVRTLDGSERILDYGCGWGRITRLMPYYFERARIHGAEVDARLLDVNRSMLPSMSFHEVESMKAMPFEDGFFDVVVAYSVFTHLSEPAARHALGELSRITAPGGAVLVTYLQHPDLERYYQNPQRRSWIEGILGDREGAMSTLESEGFVWGSTNRWPDYGIAVTTEDWIRDAFDRCGCDYDHTRLGPGKGAQSFAVAARR